MSGYINGIFTRLTAALLLITAAALLVSCGTDAAGTSEYDGVTLDVDALAEAIATEIAYDDELYKIEPYVVDMLYECSELTSASAAWSGTGATSESVAVFEAKDADGAAQVVGILEKYKLARAAEFNRYTPGEIEKLKSCVIRAVGRYAIYSVSPDSAAAEAIIDRFAKEALAAAE